MNKLRTMFSIQTFSCSYGDADRRNRVLFEFHSFSIVAVASLCFVLLGSQKLLRIYRPLYYIVSAALLLQLLSNVLFFGFYPYAENQGNCTELIVSRLYIFIIAFGELHQVFFIANVLGLDRLKFPLGKFSMTLSTTLRGASVLTVVTVMVSLFIRRLFMMTHDLWSLFTVALQLYVIYRARQKRDRAIQQGEEVDSVLDTDNDAVRTFENLSWLQAIPLSLPLLHRALEFDGIFILPNLDGVMLILEFIGAYLFYIKIIVLQEKANAMMVIVHRV